MAPATARADKMVPGEGYISDDSDFYGDEEERARLEAEVTGPGASNFWEYQARMPATIVWTAKHGQAYNASGGAATDLLSEKGRVRFHNRMEGVECARQSHENIDEFLARLPPSSSTLEAVGPQIWCMNPHAPAPSRREDKEQFTAAGAELLDAYKALKEQTEREMKGKAKSVVERKLALSRQQLEKDIKAAAQEHGIVAGKWMLFSSMDVLDETWKKVADQTWKGYLGTGAKVVTRSADGQKDANVRLICVYTYDFNDVKDVRKVLDALSRMDVIDSAAAKDGRRSSRGVWYKSDAYTHLGIDSGNEYGLRASMYGSKDMLNKES